MTPKTHLLRESTDEYAISVCGLDSRMIAFRQSTSPLVVDCQICQARFNTRQRNEEANRRAQRGNDQR